MFLTMNGFDFAFTTNADSRAPDCGAFNSESALLVCKFIFYFICPRPLFWKLAGYY